MTHLEIRTRTKHEKKSAFPEFKPEGAELIAAEIIEAATNDKRTGVALFFQSDDGMIYVATTTARMLANGLASAIKGSMHRFNDDPNLP
jgi:hypothetical protein